MKRESSVRWNASALRLAVIPQRLKRSCRNSLKNCRTTYRRTAVGYRRMGDGKFLLYSVGWNETDDGGTASDKMDQGDWVWQYPVK